MSVTPCPLSVSALKLFVKLGLIAGPLVMVDLCVTQDMVKQRETDALFNALQRNVQDVHQQQQRLARDLRRQPA